MTFTLLNAAAQAAAPVEATGVFSWAWLMIAIPAASSAILLVLGRRSDRWGHLLATLAELSMSSTPIKEITALRRTRTIAAPIAKRIPESTR